MKAPLRLRLPLLVAAGMAWGLVARPASAGETRSGGASATNSTNVAQLNEEGASLYAARDYRRAIEKFIQAYAVDSDPNLLFNIARCYEELGEVDAAIEKYEAFLKTPGADTRGKQRARESLQALRESGSQPSGAAAAPSASGPAQPGADSSPPAAKGPNYWPWAALGGSLVFGAVGTTFYVLGVSDHNQVTSAGGYGDPNAISDMTRSEAEELVSSGDTKKLIGGISLGVAGALAATYVVLLVTGDDSKASEQPSLAFDLSPHGSSVMLQGSF
ncbi:MAG TPA: tetratricopeptide repeat protein [Polyangiaceae bacterium]|nr:tetratricopeptide repeat protein [Polyangiaceae bacterium]